MLDKNVAVSVLNTQALARAKINAENFKNGIDKKLKYGESKCARYVKKALIAGGASAKNSGIESAKNYGPWLLENNFKVVGNATTVCTGGVFTISGQQVGDVVVIQAAPHHVHGHMAMFNGTHWVSDFVQERGFYPAQIYRDQNIPYTLYRYGDNTTSEQNATATQKEKIKIVWPIPSNNRGSEFNNQEEILSHVGGESTGQYMIGRSGMWHGGIHITDATTPWCALSGKSPLEALDFPVPFKGEQVGEKNPLWLKYAPGLALYKKDVATGTFTKDTKVTTRAGILPLSQVQTEVDKSTKQEYWQLRPENAYVPKGQAEPQLLSQYDLAKLGFRTETAEPASFDYLDGKNQPTGFFRNLIDSLYQAAIDDTRTSHALVKHNYQRLLDKIDSGSDRYSPMEYWRALHNPDYRDVIQKTIVKHPSDWYFKKGDAIWQPFLNALKKDAPEWKKYSEDFIDKMAWMQDVTSEKLGPSLWHMHPLKFLASLIQTNVNIRILRLRAFLRMIRIGEGTIQEDGYRTMFTGAKFTDFSKHPNTKHEANGVVSTAAGAYQFLYGTWRNLQRRYSFSDFSQSNQDLGCIALIAGRKALDAVMQDKISEAIHLCRIEWASLPGSPHGQPTANKKMIMEKYEVFLAEEKLGKTSLHATSEEMTKFIEDNHPEYL